MKVVLATIAKFLIPTAIIAVLLWRLEPEDWQRLRERPMRGDVLAAAFGVAFAAIALSFYRWWLLVRCQGIRLSVLEAFRLSAICFLLAFVSAGSVGGDLFKAVFLARRSPGKRIAAVASVLVDRGAGLYGLLLLVAAGLWMQPALGSSDNGFEFRGLDVTELKWIVATLVAVGTIGLMVLVLGGRFVDAAIRRGSIMPLVGSVIEKIGPPLRMFHHHPWAFLASLIMSVGVHAMLTVSMLLIAASLYDTIPTLAEHFVIVPLGMLASALPITPAGIGVLEATVGALYQLVPANPTPASGVLVALVFEFVKIGLAILGTLFYWTANREETDSLQAAEAEITSPSSPGLP